MATNKSLGSVLSRYLTSNANLLGSTLAILGLGATVPFHLAGDLWPAVVAGLYGAGALVAPRTRRPLDIQQGGAAAQARELQGELENLTKQLRRHRRALPDSACRSLDALLAKIGSILTRADQLAASPENLYVVAQTIRDYLPTTVQAYLSLPADYAQKLGSAGATRSALDELTAQLVLLDKQMDEVNGAIVAGDAQALMNQGKFLQERFHDSDLDLGP